MSEIDYQALYEQEKRRREDVERKYDNLVTRVKPLLDTVSKMAEPARMIEEAMQELARIQRLDSGGHGQTKPLKRDTRHGW